MSTCFCIPFAPIALGYKKTVWEHNGSKWNKTAKIDALCTLYLPRDYEGATKGPCSTSQLDDPEKTFPVWAQLGTKGLRLMNQICFRWGADGGLMGGGYSGTVIFFMKKQLNDQTYEALLRSASGGEAICIQSFFFVKI
jgi:hypothetical protein